MKTQGSFVQSNQLTPGAVRPGYETTKTMRYLTMGLCLAGIAPFHALAQASVPIHEPVRLTVAPNRPSPIAMSTMPDATCRLHPEGDTTRSLTLFADGQGVIRFEVHPSGESEESGRFVVDCEANGTVQTHPIELRPNLIPTADRPAPSSDGTKREESLSVRPALTEGEALGFSQEELRRRQYPIRPDVQTSPRAHAEWLKAVTRQAAFVPPRTVSNPGTSHTYNVGPTLGSQSMNWSGYELMGTSNTYAAVTGYWTVPAVAAAHTNQSAHSSFFVGLDGDGVSDLVQAGTAQNADSFSFCNFRTCVNYSFTTYYAWTQFMPQDQSEVAVPNLSVRPGDTMYCEVFMSDPVVG